MATYDLKYPGAAIDAILDTAYDLQNAGYIFRGLASEYSNTPTERSWVLAGEGETGHGFTSPIPKGYIGVCVFNGTSWTGKLLKCVSIDSTPTNGSTNAVSSGGAYASISQLADTVNEALDNLTFTDTTPSAFLGEYITEKVSTTDGGLERILTYFTILAATTSKAGLLSAADKAKLDAILGNLRSLEIEDTTAYADLGDKIVESIKATIGGQEETISTFQILAATASKAGLLSAADKAKLDALWSSGYQFAGIAIPSTTPISTTSKIFYIATEAGTYFNAVTVTQGINLLSWDGSTWSAVQVVGIDDVPTPGSDNLPKSGGVFSYVGNSVKESAILASYATKEPVNFNVWEKKSLKTSGLSVGDTVTDADFDASNDQMFHMVIDTKISDVIFLTELNTKIGNSSSYNNYVLLDSDYKVLYISSATTTTEATIGTKGARYVVINNNFNTCAEPYVKTNDFTTTLKSEIEDIFKSKGIEEISFENRKGISTSASIGETVDVTMSDNNNLGCQLVHLLAGETCSFISNGTSSFKSIAILDTSYKMVWKPNNNIQYVAEYTAPSECYLVINNSKSYKGFIFKGKAFSSQATFRGDANGVLKGVVGISTYPFNEGYFPCYPTATPGMVLFDLTKEHRHCIVPCKENDVFTYTAYNIGTGINRNYAIYNSSNERIAEGSAGANKGTITCPANSSYLVINADLSMGTDFFLTDGELMTTMSKTLKEVVDSLDEEEVSVLSEKIEGKYWNSQEDTAVLTEYETYNCYQPIEIDKEKVYYVNIYGEHSSKQNPVLLVDDNYNILQRYGTRDSLNELTIKIVDSNAKYLLLTSNHDGVECYYKKMTSMSGRIEEYDMIIGGQFDFRGKNVAIIGDSISTNGNYSEENSLGNVPEIVIQLEDVGVELSAYATYYDIGVTVGGHEIVLSDVGTEITFTPTIDDIGKMVGKPKNNNSATVVTWWEVAMEVLGFNPIPVCWSGASITSHEGNDDEYKTSYAWHDAQIRKCGVRTPGTMTRTAPDVVIIYRGTNDFSHSPYTKLTEDYFSGDNWNYPDTDVLENGYGYLEGISLTVKKVKEAYPEARIVLCTMNYFKRLSTNYPGYPTRNGQNSLMEYNNAIRAAANWFGCGLIEFDKDGLSHFNAISGQYYQEGSGANSTHPNSKGHKVMGTKAMRDLISQMNSMV